jgi:hypothetical protein
VDDPIDAGVFLFSGPLWVIAAMNGVTTNEDGLPVLLREDGVVRARCVREETGESTLGIVVFTDRDLADRFCEALPKPGQTPATFPSKEHFFAFLQRVQRRGQTHVCFDPERHGTRTVPIERVLAGLPKEPR